MQMIFTFQSSAVRPEFFQSSLDALKHRMVPSFAGCPGNLPLSELWSPIV